MRANYDSLKLTVEGMSGGKNTVLFDNLGMPSIMVKVPKMRFSDLVTGGTQDIHDAFICDEVTYDVLYIGKYLAHVINEHAYSLGNKDPSTGMNFDKAREYCRNNGTGWHLPTNALYAAIALWSKKNGTLPRGNTHYGEDHIKTYEKGFPSMKDGSGNTCRTATGSGPDSWYHDYNTATGIADLTGDVNEWAGGLRLVDGEIQFIPYGNAMADIYKDASRDIQGANSTLWKALDASGNFVNPGTAGTLKFDYTADPGTSGGDKAFQLISGNLAHQQTVDGPYGGKQIYDIAAASGLTVPVRLKALGLMPDGVAADYDSRGHIWMRNMGERLPFRGGNWVNGAHAGAFTVDLLNPRSNAYCDLGFRAAFYGNP